MAFLFSQLAALLSGNNLASMLTRTSVLLGSSLHQKKRTINTPTDKTANNDKDECRKAVQYHQLREVITWLIESSR